VWSVVTALPRGIFAVALCLIASLAQLADHFARERFVL
jgi:hypothetical protein